MYSMYASASNNTPAYTMLVRTWYEESTPWGAHKVCGCYLVFFHVLQFLLNRFTQ